MKEGVVVLREGGLGPRRHSGLATIDSKRLNGKPLSCYCLSVGSIVLLPPVCVCQCVCVCVLTWHITEGLLYCSYMCECVCVCVCLSSCHGITEGLL